MKECIDCKSYLIPAGDFPCNVCNRNSSKWEPNGSTTQDKIDLLLDNFKEFLKEKNIRYGDSALNPPKIFSKLDAESQLCNRIDDKIGRIKNSSELKRNDVSDLFGYIALLMISKNWIEFKDMLD